MYFVSLLAVVVRSGARRAVKSGAGSGGASGCGIEGQERSSGMGSLSCGCRRDPREAFGMSASADAKSDAVGFVRREVVMEVRV